jgi:hypothetical protein
MVSYKQGGEANAGAGPRPTWPPTFRRTPLTWSPPVRTTAPRPSSPSASRPPPSSPRPGQGIELVPVTHPNELAAGEAATFKLLRDGQPAADIEVTIARGGTRYRDNPEEITVRTGADGSFTVTWPEPGMYWINAVGPHARVKAAEGRGEGQLAYSASPPVRTALVEVLP